MEPKQTCTNCRWSADIPIEGLYCYTYCHPVKTDHTCDEWEKQPMRYFGPEVGRDS